ncbi:MAG: PHP domain-containing protein, partial [Tissierellia bacterium]|nr:PHP domain-containing protein [Tissierellia bacterium]
MSKKVINLNGIIKDEKYNYLKEFNIQISGVKIIKESMDLYLDLESNNMLNPAEYNDVVRLLKDNFPEFNLNIDITYLDLVDNLDINLYIDSLKQVIQSSIPSSASWINDLKWEKKEDILVIIPPNQIANFSLERNGLLQDLGNRVKKDLNCKLILEIMEEESVCANIFLDEKKLEEHKISKDIMVNVEKTNSSTKSKKMLKNYSLGKAIKNEIMKISDINIQTGSAVIKGDIFQIESREIRGDKLLITFNISDRTDSITVKTFLSKEQGTELLDNLSQDSHVILEGDITYDNFSKGIVCMLKSLTRLVKAEIEDESQDKRVELHLHTKMSSMDGVSSLTSLVNRAHKWGHKAIAITDHGVVQGFPEGMELANQLGVKMIYGLEGYMINDKKEIINNYDSQKIYKEYVIFDIETTGLSSINDMITEIGAVKVVDGQ